MTTYTLAISYRDDTEGTYPDETIRPEIRVGANSYTVLLFEKNIVAGLRLPKVRKELHIPFSAIFALGIDVDYGDSA